MTCESIIFLVKFASQKILEINDAGMTGKGTRQYDEIDKGRVIAKDVVNFVKSWFSANASNLIPSSSILIRDDQSNQWVRIWMQEELDKLFTCLLLLPKDHCLFMFLSNLPESILQFASESFWTSFISFHGLKDNPKNVLEQQHYPFLLCLSQIFLATRSIPMLTFFMTISLTKQENDVGLVHLKESNHILTLFRERLGDNEFANLSSQSIVGFERDWDLAKLESVFKGLKYSICSSVRDVILLKALDLNRKDRKLYQEMMINSGHCLSMQELSMMVETLSRYYDQLDGSLVKTFGMIVSSGFSFYSRLYELARWMECYIESRECSNHSENLPSDLIVKWRIKYDQIPSYYLQDPISRTFSYILSFTFCLLETRFEDAVPHWQRICSGWKKVGLSCFLGLFRKFAFASKGSFCFIMQKVIKDDFALTVNALHITFRICSSFQDLFDIWLQMLTFEEGWFLVSDIWKILDTLLSYAVKLNLKVKVEAFDKLLEPSRVDSFLEKLFKIDLQEYIPTTLSGSQPVVCVKSIISQLTDMEELPFYTVIELLWIKCQKELSRISSDRSLVNDPDNCFQIIMKIILHRIPNDHPLVISYWLLWCKIIFHRVSNGRCPFFRHFRSQETVIYSKLNELIIFHSENQAVKMSIERRLQVLESIRLWFNQRGNIVNAVEIGDFEKVYKAREYTFDLLHDILFGINLCWNKSYLFYYLAKKELP